jgi:hypothetical protein
MAEIVERPVPFPDCFARTDAAATQSQAACLLLLARQLEASREAVPSVATMVGEALAEGADEAVPPEAGELSVPALAEPEERLSRERVREVAAKLGPEAEALVAGEAVAADAPGAQAALAARLEAEPTAAWAAALSEACLGSHDELVRVAAAYADLRATLEPQPPLSVLVEGTASEDPFVVDLAATALARYDPRHPRLGELTTPAEGSPQGEPAHTSLLVHGTFARRNAWWQPGGDFHTYVRDDVRPDLYSAGDRYDWSGGYFDRARDLAAIDLRRWIDDRGFDGLDLFTHSHGGSVAMLASRAGVRFGTLVLLSCPVHRPKYWPDFGRIRRTVSIRVKLDLVILLDGGGQRFRDPAIEENVLPIWFNHSATHDPEVWRRLDLPSRV